MSTGEITYLEVVGEVEETLTLSQLMDLECIVSAEIKSRREEYRANGADTYEEPPGEEEHGTTYITITPNFSHLVQQFTRDAMIHAGILERSTDARVVSSFRGFVVSLNVAIQALESAESVEFVRAELDKLRERIVARDEHMREEPVSELRIVFDRFPGPEKDCHFIETEDATGKSVSAGEWRARPDGLVELVVRALPDSGEEAPGEDQV